MGYGKAPNPPPGTPKPSPPPAPRFRSKPPPRWTWTPARSREDLRILRDGFKGHCLREDERKALRDEDGDWARERLDVNDLAREVIRRIDLYLSCLED